jgi:hypothetical protein
MQEKRPENAVKRRIFPAFGLGVALDCGDL